MTVREKIIQIQKRNVAEQATGCVEKGKIVYYDGKGNKLDTKQAKDEFLNGNLVEVPAAGAGSYSQVLSDFGFDEVKTIETCSSAGDWTLAVHNENGWFIVCQENRYPYYGFKYSLSTEQGGFETFQDLCDYMEIFYS